jgi:hypothetical protein
VLTQVAEGVLIHESEFCQSNAVVVQGGAGVLLFDAGVHEDEMRCLASDLSELGHTVVAGFSTAGRILSCPTASFRTLVAYSLCPQRVRG